MRSLKLTQPGGKISICEIHSVKAQIKQNQRRNPADAMSSGARRSAVAYQQF